MEAKCERLLATWHDRFTEEHFNALIAPPFVVAGNGAAQQIARYRDQTVLAAARALKATYFKKDPDEPILTISTVYTAPVPQLPYAQGRTFVAIILPLPAETGLASHGFVELLIH